MIFSLSLLASFSVSGEESQSPFCPCEKIKAEKKCENPDCIKICGLQDFFSQLEEEITGKCLESATAEKSFKKEELLATDLEDFLQSATKQFKEIRAKNSASLKENCPGCDILPEISALFKPNLKQGDCPKYIQTEEYRKWRELERKGTCKSNRLIGGNEKICRLGSKFESCCPSQHVKMHEFKQNKKINLESADSCSDEKEEEIQEYFQEYVQKIVRGSDLPSAKKLWESCPSPCSFDFSYTVVIDKSNCSGQLDLKVQCTHQVEKSFFIPIYDVSIDYKEGIQCQEI